MSLVRWWISRTTSVDRRVAHVSERPVAALLAAADDSSAWTELVDRFGALVWSVARGFRFDDATCADVCQTVWLRLFERRDTIREPERLASWLASTTRNEAISLQRRRVRDQPTEDLGDEADRTASDVGDAVVGSIDDARLRGVVGEAFEQISDRCKELLRLMTAEPKLDYATISEITGRPIGSLGPTRARCLAGLRAAVIDLEAERAS